MQNSYKLIKAGAATAAIAAVGVAGLATAPAASAAVKVTNKSFKTSYTPTITPVAERSVAKGKTVTIKAGKVTAARGTKIISIKVGAKRTGAKYGKVKTFGTSAKVSSGRWTAKTVVKYTIKSSPKVVRTAFLTNQFTVSTKASPAAKISSSRAAMWNRVAKCESGGNWKISTGNGYYGGLQFNPRTWRSFGGGKYASYAHKATKAEQITIAEKVLKGQGPGAWGSCGRKAGLHR